MLPRRTRSFRAAARTGIALLAALLASACSSAAATSGSGGSAGTSAGTGVSAAAKAAYAAAIARPAKITITTPVGKPIPAGKTISFISCGQPTCIHLGQALTQADDVLGWKTVVINTDGSVQQISAAWKQVASSATDGVVATGFNRVIFDSSLQALKAKGVPVVECCTTDPPGNGITLMEAQPTQSLPVSKAWAAAVAVDSGGKADVLYADVPAFAIQEPLKTGFSAYLKQYCQACAVTNIEIPLTAIGANAPNLIVSALRAHPDIKYLISSTGGLTVGLPAALKAAGLGSVKILDQAPSLQGYEYIATGEQSLTVNFPTNESMWQATDTFARVFTGPSIAPDEVPPQYWATVSSNLPSTSTYFPNVANYQSQFEALWGK